MQTQRFASKSCVSLAVMIMLLFAASACGPLGSLGSSVVTPTPVALASPTATLPAPTATPASTATKVPPTATRPPASQVPTTTTQTFKSTKHHYIVSYPANWTIDVQTPGGVGTDAENVNLRPVSANLPAVQIYALKGGPPILGFENCKKNLLFRGVEACSMTLPKGQIPATQLLIFQKDTSHYHVAAEYEVPEQLGAFDEIVRSFQFVP